jgi:hypothetical protein
VTAALRDGDGWAKLVAGNPLLAVGDAGARRAAAKPRLNRDFADFGGISRPSSAG